MNVAQVLGYLAPRYGGPPSVALHLGAAMKRMGVDSTWWATATDGEIAELAHLGDRAFLFNGRFPKSWHRSPALFHELWKNGGHIDLFHLHQVWDYPVYAGARIARAYKKPYIVTPHGIFVHPWRYRGLKKQLYRWLLAEHILDKAACVHAVCKEELKGFQDIGIKAPFAVIPNGVNPAEYEDLPGLLTAKGIWPEIGSGPTALFLGRLSPEKGLAELVSAWRQVQERFPHAQLVIAGPGDGWYRKELESQVIRCGIADSVLVPGFLFGDKKLAVLRLADVYVQPSVSEVLSLSVIEALACAKPCVITTNCSFAEVARSGAGEVVDARADALAQGLIKILSLTERERRDMGERGRQLVAENYTWDLAARKMLTVYRCIIEQKPIPLYPEPAPLPLDLRILP